MVKKKRFTFSNCKYLCVDEADRMIDLGVGDVTSFFKICPPDILCMQEQPLESAEAGTGLELQRMRKL